MKYKKLLLAFIATIIFCGIAKAQESRAGKETRKLIREIKKVIYKESLVKDLIRRQELDQELAGLNYTGDHLQDKQKVFEVFTGALRKAGDLHSLFLSARVLSAIDQEHEQAALPSGAYLGDHVGYLKIPSCMTFDSQKDLQFANTLIEKITALVENGTESWIIDLRDNRGGNRWPMLAGLAPIIGEGLVGYNYNPAKGKFIPLNITNGQINYSTLQTQKYIVRNPHKKIAVLLGHQTGSSGEMLAIALLGFPRTASFGEQTAGYTTVNTTYSFSDGSQLFLATDYAADRTKKIYQNGIKPNFNPDKALKEPETIAFVKRWLLNE
ncbi:peptidase S41-like protein [Mucilaginibacter oryzae]|uniref:Peptidase S41-like protein n=1 Tax=Mucilaginibacter oryzae TaxID=468058 RepID=A0A316HFQ5_9SPHI|nr:S41 family peptidase [Mucilaginibacter oryzae]PWK77065.1 peptidase S41-like protein [Mucilaginibacter oryzae]